MPASPHHGRFVWHELMTSDPAAAERFYSTLVGWTATKMPMGDMDYTMFMSGEQPAAGMMAFTEDAKKMGAPPNWLAYTEVSDIDATVTQVETLGGGVIVPAQTMKGVGRFAILRDPQGAVFGAITSESIASAETDPKPREFSWHELATTDWKAASEFYEAIFGWEKKSEFDMGPMGTYYIYGRDRFTYGGMMNKTKEQPGPAYWLHYIYVADSADAAAKRATDAGARIMLPPMEVPGGDRVAVMMDPQGAATAVHSKASVAAKA